MHTHTHTHIYIYIAIINEELLNVQPHSWATTKPNGYKASAYWIAQPEC